MNRDTRIAEAFDERPKRLKPEFDRPRMFLVTGASGFLGSHLTAALLARGHRVTALCRPGRGLSPHARMARLAAWLDIRPDARTRLEVCEGEIERPRLGLDKADALRLADRVETVLHCAADTSFAARHRARVERSNLAGLNHVLDFAREAGCPDFH